MYFCPNCSYSFDINKASTVSNDVDERKSINKLPDLFKLLDTNADLSMYKSNFNKDEILKNKRYMKLSENIKQTINQIFEQHVISGAEFKCNNCNNIQPIKESLLLYQISMNNKSSKIKTLDENKFIAQDPLLPRTRDYICKNPMCITLKDTKIKEAVFYRDSDTFKLNYICTVCNFGW